MPKRAALIVILGAVVAALAFAPGHASAGELLLGRILASDAGSANNAFTGYLTAGCANSPVNGPGSCDQAFRIPTNAKITIQCDQAALVAVGRSFVDAGNGIALTAGQLFPTSTGAAVTYQGKGSVSGRTDDAGTYTGGIVAVAPAVGAGSARCRVYERSGSE